MLTFFPGMQYIGLLRTACIATIATYTVGYSTVYVLVYELLYVEQES